jgi:hypothetical protein
MKNLFFALSLILSIGIFSSCEKDEPACNKEDLSDILSGHTWEVEGTGEILIFNEDGTLQDDSGVFTPEMTDSKSWSAFEMSFSASYIDGSGSGSFSTVASEMDCDRVVLPDFGGDVILIRK